MLCLYPLNDPVEPRRWHDLLPALRLQTGSQHGADSGDPNFSVLVVNVLVYQSSGLFGIGFGAFDISGQNKNSRGQGPLVLDNSAPVVYISNIHFMC